jgi:fluoroacetyl-CoA thioesterase
VFSVSAHDGVDMISAGRHERFIIDVNKFSTRIAEKKAKSVIPS